MASRSLRSSLCCLFFSALLVFLALLGVAGCGAPDAGLASSSASPSPRTTTDVPPASPSPDPRPTPASSAGPARNLPRPAPPEAAKQNTQEGFAAFTQYWFDTVTYARETGDAEPLRQISESDCKMCNGYIAEADAVKDGSGWHIGPRWTISSFEADMILDPYKRALGYFYLDESPSEAYGPSSELLERLEPDADKSPKAIYATFRDGRWVAVQTGQA